VVERQVILQKVVSELCNPDCEWKVIKSGRVALTIESFLESVIKIVEAQLVLLKYLSRKVAMYDKSILHACKLRKVRPTIPRLPWG
jgi:hypothetical protein